MIIHAAIFIGNKEGDGISRCSDHINNIFVWRINRRFAVNFQNSIFFANSRRFCRPVFGQIPQILRVAKSVGFRMDFKAKCSLNFQVRFFFQNFPLFSIFILYPLARFSNYYFSVLFVIFGNLIYTTYASRGVKISIRLCNSRKYKVSYKNTNVFFNAIDNYLFRLTN